MLEKINWKEILKYGVGSAIAIYLVYNNTQVTNRIVYEIRDVMMQHQATAEDQLRISNEIRINNENAAANAMKIWRTICRNTSDDYLKKARCDDY